MRSSTAGLNCGPDYADHRSCRGRSVAKAQRNMCVLLSVLRSVASRELEMRGKSALSRLPPPHLVGLECFIHTIVRTLTAAVKRAQSARPLRNQWSHLAEAHGRPL